ncbi:MAG: hypothetical protein QOK15_1727 [Nocardioidaceae bacterium]|jgi:uncharacterized protein YndB with AHSA1/START domain|nr:hypothetical protein [Nocardioidaceae bacterium]
MTTSPSSTRIVGALRHLGDGKGAVRMEDLYDTDVDDLWSAVSDPDRLARWIGTVEGDDLHQGGHVYARFTSSWEGQVRIDICEAPRHLLVTSEPDTPDQTVIEATLAPEGARTRLVIEERGLPVEALPFHGSGWQAHVEDLAAHLGGRPQSDWRTRWETLTPAYQDLTIEPA